MVFGSVGRYAAPRGDDDDASREGAPLKYQTEEEPGSHPTNPHPARFQEKIRAPTKTGAREIFGAVPGNSGTFAG